MDACNSESLSNESLSQSSQSSCESFNESQISLGEVSPSSSQQSSRSSSPSSLRKSQKKPAKKKSTVSKPAKKSKRTRRSLKTLSKSIKKSAKQKKHKRNDELDRQMKADVSRLLSQASNRLTFLEKVKNKSKKNSLVWTRFKQVCVDNRPVNIYKCNDCPALFIYKHETGNSAMNRHNCKPSMKVVPKTGRNQSIFKFTTRKPTQDAINQLNSDITAGLAKDLQPLFRVETEGFRFILQACINFGAKYGQHSVDEIIQHRTTLRRTHLPAINDKVVCDMKLSLEKAPSFPKLAFSKDLWYEKYRNNDFISLTTHFINENWELKNLTLGMDEVVEEKTTENIREDCERILKNYFKESDLVSIMENSSAVTDGGSNMLKVFRRRLPCQCHRINLFMDWLFNDRPIPTPAEVKQISKKGKVIEPKKFFNLAQGCPKIHATIANMKKLVTYFKQTHLNSALTTTLKQDVETRWNSELNMLESYWKAADEVKNVLLMAGKLEKIMHINDDVVRELIEFLQPFKKYSEMLSGDKYPTISLVAFSFHKLKDHIRITAGDSTEMRKLKEQAGHCFQEYCVVEDFHYVACMLDPRSKSLKFVDKATKNRAIELLQEFMDEEMEKNNVISISTSTTTEVQTKETTEERSQFEEFFDDIVDIKEVSELERYMIQRPPSREESKKFDILAFWRDAKEFPTLQEVARWILAIPASEVSDERTFSSAGQVMSPRRTLLESETLSEMVMVHKNLNLKR